MVSHATPKIWTVYTDGASRGNPGKSGCGAIIYSPDGETFRLKKYLGTKTNNQAEYEALLMALRSLIARGAQKALIRADSELMIRQLNGKYRVKNANILPLFAEAQKHLEHFSTIRFEHIPREKNSEADRLANEAIDSKFTP